MSTLPTQSDAPVFDVDSNALPAALQDYFGEPYQPAVTPAPAASCCSTAKQETCCEPSDKDACCGTEATSGGGCGCQ